MGLNFKKLIRWVVIAVLPLVVLFFFMFQGYAKSIEQRASIQLRSELEKGNLVIANQIEAAFAQFVSDLLVVAKSGDFALYITQRSETNKEALAGLFGRIITQKQYISHIRFLNESGMEIIQADRCPGEPVHIVDEAALEDQKYSSLFQTTKGFASNSLYISEIFTDASDIDGSDQALTIGIPLYDGDTFLGVVAIDFDACYLLDFLSAYQSSLSKELTFSLIDEDGKWVLIGQDTCDNVYVAGENLFNQNKKLMDAFDTSISGIMVDGKTTYAYLAVIPRTSEPVLWHPGKGRLWTLVSFYDADQLPLLANSVLLSHPILKWVFSFALFLVGTIGAVIVLQRLGDKRQMRISSLISDFSTNGIVVSDETSKITFCNRAFERISRQNQSELIGRSSHSLRYAADWCDKLVCDPLHGGNLIRPAWLVESEQCSVLTSLSITEIRNRANKVEHTIDAYSLSLWNPCEFIDLCLDHEADPSWFFKGAMSLHDPLSSVQCIAICISNGKEIGIQLSQIDRISLANAISATLEASMGESSYTFCFSCDWYLTMITSPIPDEELAQKLTMLFPIIQALPGFPFGAPPLHIVAGISHYPQRSSTVTNMAKDACIAAQMLFHTKTSSYLFFNEDVHHRFHRKQTMASAIQAAFKNGEIKLYYQSQIDIASNRIIGSEALIRWFHPILGYVGPDEFIPIMEEHNQLGLLSDFVITHAVDFLSRNQEEILRLSPHFSLAINLNADELANPDIPQRVIEEVDSHGIARHLLSVELTEHTAVDNFNVADSILEKFHGAGILVAIDDFGTGFSSLSYLMELTLDKIKVDRNFIKSYPASGAITIFKTVILLAKELGIDVIAEGVETEQQLQFLREIGCSQYQGFLFSMAVDEGHFLEQLRRQNS